MTGIKNINKAEVMALKDQVEYHDGQVEKCLSRLR